MSAFWLEFWRYFSLFSCHSMIFYKMTDCRFSRRANRWTWALLCVFNTFFSIALTLSDLFYTGFLYAGLSAVSMLSYMVCYAYISHGSWRKKLFLFSVYATVFYLVQQTSYVLALILFPTCPWASFTVRTVFFCILTLLMWWRWQRVMDALEANIGGNWGSLTCFALATNVVVYAATLTWVALLHNEPGPGLAVLLTETSLVVVEYASLVRIVILLGQQQSARAEEAQRKLLESQIAAERVYVEQAWAHRHDMQHYMTAIGGYIEKGDLDGAKAYLTEHQALLDRERLAVYCENTVANALLRLYQNRCQTAGVPCEIQVSIPEQMALNGLELATVLGNVLENAWEANSRAHDPKLTVRAYHNNNGLLLIEIENGVSGEVKFRDGLPQTNKAGGGQGLRNVVRVLDKHGGKLRCGQRGDCFFTQIVCPFK